MQIRNHAKLSANEEAILEFIEHNLDKIGSMTIQTMAKQTFSSTSTIFRLAKKLGFDGYSEMIYELTHYQGQHTLNEENVNELAEIFSAVFERNRKTSEELKHLFANNDATIYILGTGYSGIIAEYLYKKLLGKGTNVIFSNGADSNALFLNNINRIDILLCVSKSGLTPTITEKAQIANQHQIPIVSFTQDSENKLATLATHNFVIENHQKFDWNNQKTGLFFPVLLMVFECLFGN